MKTLFSIVVLLIGITSNLQAADPYCGPVDIPGRVGPYDYTNPQHKIDHLPVVEGGHFTPKVRNLIAGETGSIGGDLNYVLRAFPNHHKALQAFAKLWLREKGVVYERPPDETHTIECAFDRAIRYKPGDAMVRMIYANYLLKIGGRLDDAVEQYQIAVKLQPENAVINYNVGLLYEKEKDYEQAVIYAKKAYGLGFPLPGLKKKLMAAGKWDGKLNEEKHDETNYKEKEKTDAES